MPRVPPFPKCSIILPQSFSPSSSPKQQRCTSYCLLSSLSIHHFKSLLSSDSAFYFSCSTPLVSCHVSVFPNECLENYRRESKFFCFSSGYESTFPEPSPTFRHPLGGFQFVCSREDIIPYVRFQQYSLAPSSVRSMSVGDRIVTASMQANLAGAIMEMICISPGSGSLVHVACRVVDSDGHALRPSACIC